jgi:hypothetical protein
VIFDNSVERDMIGLLKSLSKVEMDEVISTLNLSNKTIVILENK